MPELSVAFLRELCRREHLYASCPELNDVLRLQRKGITRIQALEPYTGLKTLYLQGNGIEEIEGLSEQKELTTLYVNQNLLHSLATGLSALTNLRTLDVSDNTLASLHGLQALVRLQTLYATNNRLRTQDDVAALALCRELRGVDLAGNQIDDEQAVETIKGVELSLLVLKGNPVVNQVRHYRKSLIAAMPSLNYLDESPVFPKEERLAQAFVRGGVTEEREERKRIREEEEAERQRHRDAFKAMVEAGKAKRQRELMEQEEAISRQFHGLEPRPEAGADAGQEAECGGDYVLVQKDEAPDAPELEGLDAERHRADAEGAEHEQGTGKAGDDCAQVPAAQVAEVERPGDGDGADEDAEATPSPEEPAPTPEPPTVPEPPAPAITPEQLAAHAEMQRVLKAEAVKREMARSAARAEALTSYGGDGSDGAAPTPPRPAIWGTDRYASLWAAAKELGERQEADNAGEDAANEVGAQVQADAGQHLQMPTAEEGRAAARRKRHAWLPSDDEYSSSDDNEPKEEALGADEAENAPAAVEEKEAAAADDDGTGGLGDDPAAHAAAAAAAAAAADSTASSALNQAVGDAGMLGVAEDESDEDGLLSVD